MSTNNQEYWGMGSLLGFRVLLVFPMDSSYITLSIGIWKVWLEVFFFFLLLTHAIQDRFQHKHSRDLSDGRGVWHSRMAVLRLVANNNRFSCIVQMLPMFLNWVLKSSSVHSTTSLHLDHNQHSSLWRRYQHTCSNARRDNFFPQFSLHLVVNIELLVSVCQCFVQVKLIGIGQRAH